MRLIDKPLTEMQRKFARYHVEAKYGNQHLTNTECAIKAGYAPDSAYQRAYESINGFLESLHTLSSELPNKLP